MKKTLLHILMHNGCLLQRAVNAELTPLGLHHEQGWVLTIISACREITQADLARRMDIRPATVSNMFKPLEKKKLIRRKTDPHPHRAQVVSLTPSGKDTCKQALATWKRVEACINKTISKTERDGLIQGLEKVRNTLGGKGSMEEKA